MKIISRALYVAVAVSLCASIETLAAQSEDGPVPAANEIVMVPGSTITETGAQGTLTVTAGRGLKRCYTWEGATRCVEMEPRDERWYGSFGLYFPGPGDHWAEHNGITRAVTEEGQQHFRTTDEALKWLQDQKYPVLIYRNDGLAMGWGKNLPRRQLNVSVWQILIDGKKPGQLQGSQDSLITIGQDKPNEH
jgi:hypothetical protein